MGATRMVVVIPVAIALLAGLGAPVFAEGPALTWKDYRLGQFIASRGKAPSEILDLDNNSEILLACRDGCTVASLEDLGVGAISSQLELLRAWALLKSDGTVYRAAIPIIDGQDAVYLEELAGRLAAKLAAAIEDDVAELVVALGDDGMESHAWAVVFSYVLDGTVWQFLEELGTIATRDVSHGGAPWGGEVWLHVARGVPGTSALRRPSVVVKMSWVGALQPQVESLLQGPTGIGVLLDALEKGNESPALRSRFQEYGILGPERQLTVPVILEARDNAIFAICERLTERVATTVASGLDRGALINDFGFASESQAMIVTYHGVMWSLMERLVADGALALPAAIADPQAAAPADLGKLAVVVRQVAAEPLGATAEGSRRDQD